MLTDRSVALNLGFLAAWALIGAASAIGAVSAAGSRPDPPPPPPPTFWIEELSDEDE